MKKIFSYRLSWSGAKEQNHFAIFDVLIYVKLFPAFSKIFMIAKTTIDQVYETARLEEVIGDFVQLKKWYFG